MRTAFVLVVISTLSIYVEAVRLQQKGFNPVDLPSEGSTRDKFKNLSYPSDSEIWDSDIEKDCVGCKEPKKKKKSSRQTQDAT
jgi:hypothetical protein